jgi:glycosyltransferase involved in cell wall biosynthesis
MTRIGIDARLTYYRDGGISTYIRRLIEALLALEHRHRFLILQMAKDRSVVNPGAERINLFTPAHHRWERLALSVELARHKLDILHSPDFIPPLRGAKHHVITVHDLTFLHYPDYLTADSRRYYNQQIAVACQHADHILAVSEATRQDLISMLQVPAQKITVQPHGVTRAYRPLTSSETDLTRVALNLPERYFLHVGTWEPRKNIVGFLRGYRLLLEQVPDSPPVVLVGRPGWLFEQSMREIESLKLGDRVVWRDQVSDEQLPAIYNLACALVSASFYEGFGMPALEAMACGITPIVSNRSSFPEVVADVGLLIEPENPQSIADALLKVLHQFSSDGDQRRRCIDRAATFTWERSARIALQAYQSVL